MLKKSRLFLSCIVLSFLLLTQPSSVCAQSSAQCFIEATSGRILYCENENEIRQIASTTKIMTAVIALEYGDPESIVTVSKEASLVGGSCIGLKEGYTVKLKDLIIATLFVSGNDGAYAIAEHIGGSIDGFCTFMNNKALEIGCKSTNFSNPHGLPDVNNFSTAYELALIAAYAIQNEEFRNIVSSQSMLLNINGSEWQMSNKDGFLSVYDSAIGIKTGYTDAAGRCFVSAAEKNGMIICGAVLNSDDIYKDSKDKMEELYSIYSMKEAVTEGSYLFSIDVKNSDILKEDILSDQSILLPLKEGENFEITFDKTDFVYAPVKKRIPVGFMNIDIDGKRVAVKTIYLETPIEKKKLTPRKFVDYFKLTVKFIS